MLDPAYRLANAIRTAAGVLLVIVGLAMVAVISGRYVGFVTAWADEVARIAFIWSASLGAASGTHRGLNFCIPLIATERKGRTKQVLESGIALLVVVLCALMLGPRPNRCRWPTLPDCRRSALRACGSMRPSWPSPR